MDEEEKKLSATNFLVPTYIYIYISQNIQYMYKLYNLMSKANIGENQGTLYSMDDLAEPS